MYFCVVFESCEMREKRSPTQDRSCDRTSTELLNPSAPSEALTTPLTPDGTVTGENAENGIGLFLNK